MPYDNLNVFITLEIHLHPLQPPLLITHTTIVSCVG